MKIHIPAILLITIAGLGSAVSQPANLREAVLTPRLQFQMLKVKDIDKAEQDRNTRFQRNFDTQKAAIARETNVRSLQIKAEMIAKKSMNDLEAASRQQAKLEKEKVALAALSVTLEKQKAGIETEKAVLQTEKDALQSQNEKLEFREKIFSGSFAGLFITAALSVFAAFRAGRSGKLENRKRELEIAKLERELGQSRGDNS